MHHYCLFETAIGPCGLLWNGQALLRLQLPAKNKTETKQLLLKKEKASACDPEDSPTWLQEAMRKIRTHLDNGREDLRDIPLDMSEQSDFFRRVYLAAKEVPPGARVSYGELADRVGSPGAARAVGQAMGKNPWALIVPCHRVVAAGGKVGGFSAWGGLKTKKRLLDLEAAALLDWEKDFAGGAKLAAAHLQKQDEILRPLIKRVGACTLNPKRGNSTFEALATAIVFQQLSGKAASTILGRFIALFSSRNFPSPEDVAGATEERLRSAGLSRAKALALLDLADKSMAGQIPSMQDMERMDDESIVEVLTAVRGIGRWTVEMLLIFDLGRVDVLPVSDYAIRKAYAKLYRKRNLPDAATLQKFGESWKPYRSIASWYLWRSLDEG